MKKLISSPLILSAVLSATSLYATIDTYTWVGGNSDNSLSDANNWIPTDGPPGSNEAGLFDTTNNPAVCAFSDSVQIGEIITTVSGVEISVLGDLTVDLITTNANTATSFNVSPGATLSMSSPRLTTLGTVNYNFDNATFNISNNSRTGVHVSLSNGSSFLLAGSARVDSLSSSSLSDTITLNGSLTLGDSSDQLIAGSFSSNGSIVKIGSGTVTLTGTSINIGDVEVFEGTFVMNGSMTDISVLTVSSALLKGTGHLGPITAEFGGMVAPGNSIGTLHTGPATFTSNSIFQVEISPSAASLLDVTGTATLSGSVQVVQDAGTYPLSNRYEILNATSISGSFDSIMGITGYNFSLSQEGDILYLLYEIPLIPTSSLSGNALTIANDINGNEKSSTIVLLNTLTGSSLENALNSVSPARNAFGTYITEQMAFSLNTLLTSHTDLFHHVGTESNENAFVSMLTADSSNKPTQKTPKAQNDFCVWGSGFGEFSHQSASSQNPSFNYISEAALAGIDYLGGENWLLGGALGYAHTNFYEHHHAGHGHINYYLASLYARSFVGSFYFSPAVWGIFNQIENTRSIAFSGFSENAHANIFAWQLVPHLEVGYEFDLSWGHITPFTSADWAISWQRGYEEKGASPFNAKQKAKSSSMVRSETGVKFCETWEKSWGSFFLREKASYVFEKPYGVGTVNASFVGSPSNFTVAAVNQNLNLADIGIDFTVAIGKEKPISINLGYDGEFGSNYWSNQLMLTVKKAF